MSQTKKPQTGRDERGRFTKDHKIGEATRFAKENAAACKYHEEYADQLIEFFNQPNTRTEYSETLNGKGEVVKRVPIIIPNESVSTSMLAICLARILFLVVWKAVLLLQSFLTL